MYRTGNAPETHIPGFPVRWQAFWLAHRLEIDLPCVWIGLSCLLVGLTRPVVGLIVGAPFRPGLDTLSAAIAFVLATTIRVVSTPRHSSESLPICNEPSPVSEIPEPTIVDILPLLTKREWDVLCLLAEPDLTVKEIGLRLRLSQSTVRTHERHIGEKLAAHGRWSIVAEAWRQGLLPTHGARNMDHPTGERTRIVESDDTEDHHLR